MGATRRRTYAAAEAATAATGSEARPSQASPSAAAAGGDGASPMGTAGAPMVNEGAPMVAATGSEASPPQGTPSAAAAATAAEASPMEAAGASMNTANDAEFYDQSSSDEEGDGLDRLLKLSRGQRAKKHARCQVPLPAGTQVNVTHINTFCSNENPLWEHIGYTEVPSLPLTATNRFNISDDISKAYAKIAERANDLAVSNKPADDGSKVLPFYCDPNTVSQGAAILAPPPTSDVKANVLAINKADVADLQSKGYTVVEKASALYVRAADDTKAAGADADEPPDVNIPVKREQWPSLSLEGGDFATALVQAWEDGYSVDGKSLFSPFRMWTKAARKRAWTKLTQKERDANNTRLGSLGTMYWAVTHIDTQKETMPTTTRELEAKGAALLRAHFATEGKKPTSADAAAAYADAVVARRGQAKPA